MPLLPQMPGLRALKLRARRSNRRFTRSGKLMLALSLLMLCVSCAHRGLYDFGGSIKLGNLQTGETEYSLKRPKGSHHCRLIAVCAKTDAEGMRAALEGKAVVKRDGQAVLELAFSPDTLRECTWLDDRNKKLLAAYFLHDQTTLDQSIKEQGEYTVEITLSGQPPSDSTVWFFYLPWHFGYF